LAILAVIVLLVTLVTQFPASFALAWLPEKLRSHVRIERASGTLWRGEAELASPWVPATQHVAWHCRPDGSLRLACTLDGVLRGALVIDRSGRLEGRALRASVPMQVSLQGTPRATVDQLEVSIEEARADRTNLAVKGTASLRGLVVAAAPGSVHEIGEITADCAPSGAATQCRIQSRGDPAPVTGSVELSAVRTRGQLQVNLPGLPAQTLGW
jgi:hypothetical protein